MLRIASLLVLLLSVSVRAHAIMVWDYPSRGGLSPAALANPNVDGGLIKVRMGDVEPTEGVFNWTNVQAEIAKVKAVGKRYELDPSAAWSSPAWLYADGVPSFSWVWTQTWGLPICSTATAPIFWNPTFQAKYFAFVDAMAKQFGGDPDLYAVKLDGIGASTDETLLPRDAPNTPINNGQCFSSDDTATWLADGYTLSKISSSFSALANKYAADFPTIALDLMIVPSGFPNDPPPALGASWGGVEDVLTNDGSSAVLHFNIQNNGWNNVWGMQTFDNNRPVTVWQEVGALGASFPQAAALAVSSGTVQWVEVYESDITNPNNQAVLAQLHATGN